MGFKIAVGVITALVIFLGFVASRPADYTISREITINASAEKIFPFLDSTKLADTWGPWREVDPQIKMSYSGPETGVGSKASWVSPGQMGTGSATIVDVTPNSKVGIQLEYIKPMNMIQYAEYIVRSENGASVVTWRVQGKNSFIGRLMCMFINMDAHVGSMFDKGLNNLKVLVERQG